MKEMMPFHNLKTCTLLGWWIIIICPTEGSLSHVIGRSTESRVGLQYQHFASAGVCVSVNRRISGWWCCVSGDRWSGWHPVEHLDLQLNPSWSSWFTALAGCQYKCVYVCVYVCMYVDKSCVPMIYANALRTDSAPFRNFSKLSYPSGVESEQLRTSKISRNMSI